MYEQLVTAVFPSAASVHLWHALDNGIFTSHGLDVRVIEVRSSTEQMRLWDSGALTMMHTSPDHLLRPRERDPVAIAAEGIGDLTVHARQHESGEPMQWGVDGADSAFALVLRAILEANTVDYGELNLVEVGGTKQRLEALLAGTVDGAALHTPFDATASAAGFKSIGSHHDVHPDFLPVVVVAERMTAQNVPTRRYLDALAEARADLLHRGVEVTAGTLTRRGWDNRSAELGAEAILRPGGLVPAIDDLVAGIRAAIELRQRFNPGWAPAHDAAHYAADLTIRGR